MGMQAVAEVATQQEVLVSPEWLEERLQDPRLRVVEVDVSPKAYAGGHIEGAVLWNIYQDFRHPDYTLVDPSAIEALIARSGITPESTVVFYGYGPVLGFWLMKLYGHGDVRILDCSRASWQAEGRPWTADTPDPAPTEYRLPPEDPALRAHHQEVEQSIGRSGCTLLDVRSEAEYRGERFWPSGGMEEGGRAGHVPGARWNPIDGLYDDRGAFRSRDELARVLAGASAVDGELITYCTIGSRAATAWFVLTYLLGRRKVRVYDGSWAEWGKLPGTPVEAGASSTPASTSTE